ncbi:hypothetical protein MLD38_008151 [Melastoma candidum]|uniref:Uncharacterized protein n=1 Tax=Melastoma candidum TaxID=119954 RepID=A0ACB9RT39_9MYRT|nr:hypothetical protein MLD38_008151 [Melastoma candidum]
MYSCKTCENYHLHKACAELPQKVDHHPFHPLHSLPVVFNGPSYACCGCGKKHDKVLYCCWSCNFTLNPECALNPTSKYEFVGEGKIRTSCTSILLPMWERPRWRNGRGGGEVPRLREEVLP